VFENSHSLETLVMAPAPPCTAIAHNPSGFGDVTKPFTGSRVPNFGGLLGVSAVAPVTVVVVREGVAGAGELLMFPFG
jgi:hypothetical protein